MRTKRNIFCLAGVILALLFSGSVWAGAETIRVGLLAPMAGSNPDWGSKQTIGLEMAIDKINQRGGIAGTLLEAAVMDTGGDAEKGADAYRKLVEEDKVLAIIGPLYTHVYSEILPYSNEAKVIVIATASAKPGLSDLEKWPYGFRMTVTSDKKEAPLAKAWASKFGIRKVVILNDGESAVWVTVAEKIWPKIMKDLNIEILNRNAPLSFPMGQRNFRKLVESSASYHPDGICITAHAEETGYLVKEIRRQGLKQPILGASGAANPKVIEIAGEAAEGLWSTGLFYPEDPNPKVRNYVKEFTRRCKEKHPGMNNEPEQYDVVVHDSLMFLADIMKKKGITGRPEKLAEERQKIRDGLAGMGVWRGTAGMMAFDKKGDGIRTVHIIAVKNGKWQAVK